MTIVRKTVRYNHGAIMLKIHKAILLEFENDMF